jgi:hypothetical protein
VEQRVREVQQDIKSVIVVGVPAVEDTLVMAPVAWGVIPLHMAEILKLMAEPEELADAMEVTV